MALRALGEGIPDALIVDADIILNSAISVLPALREKGYTGSVIVLEDPGRPLPDDHLAEGLSLQPLAKPLEMHKLFRAVEHALAAASD